MPYKNKQDMNRYLKEYYEKKKAIIRAAKSVPCADCGKSYPHYVMDFDHINDDKVANVNELRRRGSIAKLELEIKKCEVVCANCHRERTHQRTLKQTAW